MKLYEYSLKRKGLIIQIGDGWGEIAPLPGFSKETFEEAKQEALDVLFDKKTPTLPSVIFGFSSAKRPLTPVRVPLCALHKPHSGCKTLKLKLGHLSVDEAIKLVKEYIGKYSLRLDFNQKWSLSQALSFARNFKKTDFEYLEEPVKEYEDLLYFSEETGFPIALDESRKLVPTVKALVVKPTLWGEIPKSDIPIVLSSSYESSLGILQIAALSNSNLPQGLDTFSPDFINPPIRVEDGYLTWTPSKNPVDTSKLCLIAP